MRSDRLPHIAAVIPAYQEERLLPITLAGLPPCVQTVVIVDDASTDRTRELALQFAQTSVDKGLRVSVLSLTENSGVGRAICVGYLQAYSMGAEVAVVMGADAQMDPSELSALVEALWDEIIYVKGERMSHPLVRDRMPKVRYWGNRVLSWITGRLSGQRDLIDAQCGYTALDLSYLSNLPLAALYPRYGFPNDLLIRIHEQGGVVAQVPVTPIYDSEVSSLSIPRVILPLVGLFVRALARRLNPLSQSRVRQRRTRC